MADLIEGIVKDGDGVVVAGAKGYVYSDGVLATGTQLANALGVAVANPMVADSLGFYSAYVTYASKYRIDWYWLGRKRFVDAYANNTAKGDPGGNVMAIGLFTVANTLTIATGTDLVQTSGYSVTGKGSAQYIYDAAVNAAYVIANPRSSFVSSNGRGYRLSEDQTITPEMFGALRGGADDGTAINALFLFCIGRTNLAPPQFSGTYSTSIPLVYSNPDTVNYGEDSTLCTTFIMKCTFIATAAMDHILTFQRVNNLVVMGRIRFTGGGFALAARYAQNGMYLDNCGGFDILANVTGTKLLYSVTETESAPSNNNLARFDAVRGSRVGASSFSDNLHTANFSARVDTGMANSSGQLATFTVDSLPPVYTDAANRPVFAIINGYYHRVISVNRGTSKVSLTPWPSTAVATGSLRYAYGSVVSLRGSDGNLINIGTISSQGAAGALSMQALYGGAIGTVHCENTGIALTVGNDPGSTMLGLTIDRLYCEGADVHAAFQVGTPDSIRIAAASPFDENKIITAGWFSPGGATTPVYAQLPVSIWINGKSSTPARNDSGNTLLQLDLPHEQNQVWTAPTATPSFDIYAPVNDVQQAVYRKPFRMSVEVPPAITASGIPTSVTFNAPVGWTVNGAASAVFSNIKAIPDFSITTTYATSSLTVRQLVLLSLQGQTLSNQATITPAFLNDYVVLTGQAQALVVNAPTGTAADEWGISLRIKDNGTARAITWNAIFRVIGTTLPATTVANKWTRVGIVYNATDTKWDVVAVAQEA